MSTVIDVHTHMLNDKWLETILEHGGNYTLKELEQAYPDHLLRVHRHTLVGVRFIQGLRRSSDGQNQLALKGNATLLPVSRRHASHVRQWLQEHQPSP